MARKPWMPRRTSGAAEALGLGFVTGRVAPGYRADLLVVDGPDARLQQLTNWWPGGPRESAWDGHGHSNGAPG
ncbi:hypothetical protein C0Q99_19470 [Streptomyces albidoflavus]|nr:hypothetical protein C0Q99_19470 [Streptomyces albidoflavus]